MVLSTNYDDRRRHSFLSEEGTIAVGLGKVRPRVQPRGVKARMRLHRTTLVPETCDSESSYPLPLGPRPLHHNCLDLFSVSFSESTCVLSYVSILLILRLPLLYSGSPRHLNLIRCRQCFDIIHSRCLIVGSPSLPVKGSSSLNDNTPPQMGP